MFSPRRKALKKGDENKERKRKAPMFHHKQSVFSKRFDVTQPWAAVGTWFVGPKAENADIFKELMIEAIDSHFKFREDFYPCDPPYVTDQVREAQSFKKSMKQMKRELGKMREDLHKSVPFFSTRYKGHVIWDTAVPANLGYLATLLWNQNNCIAEASPVTTEYELEAGSDLCEMIGFKRKDSMGHLVTGGSVANIEAMWMARNLKYYPLGLQEALLKDERLAKAKGYKIYLPQRENTPSATVPLVDATAWELLNLDTDTIVKMPGDVEELAELPKAGDATKIVDAYLYETIGPHEFYSRHNLKKPPCIVAASTYHVSFLKAVNIIGLGKDGLVLVPVDENARMDCDELKRILQDKLANQIPVISVISIMGTTEESAVDPLVEILKIRKELRVVGLNFSIHADAAWGAYFRTIQIDPPKMERSISPREEGFVPELSLNKHVTDQMEALYECDTVTCDPHKSGFCPYPAGGICYRDKRLTSFLNLSIPPYYHGKTNLGTLAIEGSKPGAAASGVLLANKVIGLHKQGYGRILSECMFTSKIMYCYWVCLAEDGDDFVVETTKPLPNETEDPKTFIKKNILGRSNEDIAKDPEVMEFLREIGPDTLIPCFSVNVRGNTDVDLTNKLVQAIFNALSHDVDSKSSQRMPLIVTSSTLTHTQHSTALKKFKERLGLDPKNKHPVEYVITTCLDPWSTSMEFMDDMAYIMRNTILNAIGTETDTKDYHNFVSVDKVNKQNEIFVCYAGNFKMTQHQYFVVARFKFLTDKDRDTFKETSDSKKKPIVLRNPKKKRLHNLLFNDSKEDRPSEKFDFFVDLPADSVPFMTADMEIVDVPRYDHFDKADDQYPNNATYVMYGDVGNVYLFHVPTKDPDYLQVVSIGEGPKEGFGKDPLKKEMILKHGVDAELLGVPGNPTEEEGRIVDPLKMPEYNMNFVGSEGKEVTTPVAVQKKIWFDGEVLNK